MKHIAVAVDGPAGAGKSSVSKAVAADLGLVYIDTGAMYRSVALFAIQNGIDIKNDPQSLIDRLDEIDIGIKHGEEGQIIYLNGVDVTGKIRTPQVSVGASDAAVIKEVRQKLVAMQRKMAENDSVIMDGRDICGYVLPNADVKIFLTASVDARSQRRYKELREKGETCDFEKIKADIEYRDYNDSTREESPLKRVSDAVPVDTSDLTFNESVALVKRIIEEKTGKADTSGVRNEKQ